MLQPPPTCGNVAEEVSPEKSRSAQVPWEMAQVSPTKLLISLDSVSPPDMSSLPVEGSSWDSSLADVEDSS
jgi:hypothetical protein